MVDQLTVLQDTIRSCTNCWLHAEGNGPVPYRGKVPTPLLFIGEAPGDVEDDKGQPFVGPAGNLLSWMMRDAGLVRWKCSYANTVSCHPGKTKKGYRVPDAAERLACRDNLDLQLAMAKPKVVVLLGVTAMGAFRPDFHLTDDRGRPFLLPCDLDDRPVAICTWHPAAAIRAHKLKDDIRKDLKQAAARLKPSKPKTWRWPEDCRVCHKELDHYDEDGVPYCDDHIPWPEERADQMSLLP